MDDLVSPFDESTLATQPLAKRLRDLRGKRVTLLSISKPKSAEYLDEVERLLVSRYGLRTARVSKPTFTKPASQELIEKITADSDAVIEALAD